MGEVTRYTCNSVKKGYNLLRGKRLENLDRRMERLTHKQEINEKLLNDIVNRVKDPKKSDPILDNMANTALRRRQRYDDHLARLESKRNFEENKTNLARAAMLGTVITGTVKGALNSIPQAEIPDYVNHDGTPYYRKTASEKVAGNVPRDTSKPTDASPSEAADYYDFHEYLLDREPHPDRKDLPQLNLGDWKNAPQKIAHDLGVDLYTVNVIEEELGLRDRMPIKEAAVAALPGPTAPKVGRAKPGSSLLGLAIISAGAALTNKAILERGLQPPSQEELRPSYAI